jgi:hypothetical protein
MAFSYSSWLFYNCGNFNPCKDEARRRWLAISDFCAYILHILGGIPFWSLGLAIKKTIDNLQPGLPGDRWGARLLKPTARGSKELVFRLRIYFHFGTGDCSTDHN